MAVDDVYLLALHQPLDLPGHPVPVNATIVHARSLLSPAVPQPDGGMMYRCLTEFPNRTPGCVVPVSTLTYELDGGDLWPEVADWAAVSDAVVDLALEKGCDAMHFGLSELATALLASGPVTMPVIYTPSGRRPVDPRERQQGLDDLANEVRRFLAEGPFWPGDDLVPPPAEPVTLPYRPFA